MKLFSLDKGEGIHIWTQSRDLTVKLVQANNPNISKVGITAFVSKWFFYTY